MSSVGLARSLSERGETSTASPTSTARESALFVSASSLQASQDAAPGGADPDLDERGNAAGECMVGIDFRLPWGEDYCS